MTCAIAAIREPSGSAAGRPGISKQAWPAWLAFGLFTGLAMLSKYTAVLPAVAVFFALLTCPEGRSQFRKPGVWLAAIAALIVFSPTVYWNATHQWASFKYQLHHGLDAANLVNHSSTGQRLALHLGSLGEYLLGQIAFFTPVFFVFGVVVLFLRWREYRTLSQAHRILVWSTTLPLLFFAFVALKSGSPGEANWPAFAYFPMSLLIVDHVARAWKASDVQWIRIGCAVALAITLPLHSPDLLYRLGWKQNFPRKLNEFYGWREMGRSVGANRGDALVVAGSHQDAAELAFYMPGQPEVWVYNFPGRDGKPNSRPTAFDYFPDRPDLSKVDRLLFFYGDTTDFCRAFGFIPVANYDFRIFLHGRERSRSYVLLQRRSNPADRTYSP